MTRRGLLALLTALCLAWASSWPLVAAARASLAAASFPICGPGGAPVRMGSLHTRDGLPGAGHEVHCPLCVMSIDAAFAAPATLPSCPARFAAAPPAARPAAPPVLDLRLPESRAPPSGLPR